MKAILMAVMMALATAFPHVSEKESTGYFKLAAADGTTADRVKLMQQAIDDQRDMLRRNIKKPITEIPLESDTDGEIPLWMEALTPIRNFSKEPEDNVFCRITANSSSFDASTLRVYLLDPGIVLQEITLK